MQLGYIGLGIMGSAMAKNLLRAGHRVTVWNRTASKTDALRDAGAAVAHSPADVAARCDVVFVNVTDTPDVEAVLFGPEGVERRARPGLIVVDHSTISPEATRRFAARLGTSGVTLLDAPVSGGDLGAKNGTLSIMVGGDRDAFERVLPLLNAMGKTITHVGPSGAGQVCKACNQIAVVATLAGVCEAIAFARRSGLDPATMLQVVGGGAGASWQLANLGPRIVAGDFAPGFMVELAIKDLSMVLEAARTLKLDAKTAQIALAYLEKVRDTGGARLGTQAIASVVG